MPEVYTIRRLEEKEEEKGEEIYNPFQDPEFNNCDIPEIAPDDISERVGLAEESVTQVVAQAAAAAECYWTKKGTSIYYNKGNVGIGNSTPPNLLSLLKIGLIKGNTDFIELYNTANAADMDGTTTSILWKGEYYSATSPGVKDVGRIGVGAEADWTFSAVSEYDYINKVGSYGTGIDNFWNPSGLDSDGTYLYIADQDNNRIQKRLISDLSFIMAMTDTGANAIADIYDICYSNGFVYHTEYTNCRIQKRLASDLSYVNKIGSSGSGNDQFTQPRGICTDGTNLYVLDYGNNRIVKRLCSDLSYVSKIGTTGTGNDNFSNPYDICTDGTYLYVTDSGNQRIVKRLCSDLSYVSEVNVAAGETTPNGIFYYNGYIYVGGTDTAGILYKRKASDLSYVSKTGTYDSGDTNLHSVFGGAADQNYLYIVDTGNQRIVLRATGTTESHIANLHSYIFFSTSRHGVLSEKIRITSKGNLAVKRDSADYSVDVGGSVRVSAQFISSLPDGVKPIDVTSTTVCTNLNADLLDGSHASSFVGTHVILDGTVHTDSLAGTVVKGDIIHGNATPKWARLAGNTTTTKKYLTQTGTGAVSAIPVWDTVASSEIDHDSTTNFVANKHIDHTSVSIDTTTPLAGGGTIAATRTLTLAGLSSIGTANYLVGVNAGATAWEFKQLIEGANITITHAAGSITIAAAGGAYTDEEAQDAVGGILVDTATIDFTYDDITPQITADVIPGGVDHDSLLNVHQDVNTVASPTFIDLTLTGIITLPVTVSSVTGIIFKSTNRFIHDFTAAGTNGLNTFIGVLSGNFTMAFVSAVTDASTNTAVGYSTLVALTSGYMNVAIGDHALYQATTGYANTAVGNYALQALLTGYYNIAIGANALFLNTGVCNSSIGVNSMLANTSGTHNVAVGYDSLKANTTAYGNVAIGAGAFQHNTTGQENTILGYVALCGNTTGHYNVVIGSQAGYSVNPKAIANSVFIGYQAGYAISTGSNNILIGYRVADNLTTGANNIIIGYDIDSPAVDSANILNIGNLIFATTLDGTGTTLSTGNVGIGTSSPDCKLQVVGMGSFGADLDPSPFDNGLSVVSAAASAVSLFLWQNTVGNAHIGFRASGATLYIVNSYGTGLITDDTATITLDALGRTVIGGNTAILGARLSVFGYATTAGTDSNIEIGDSAGVYLRIARTPTNTFRIDMSGVLGIMGANVGINDLAPAERLDVDGNINVTGVYKIDDAQVLNQDCSTTAGPTFDHIHLGTKAIQTTTKARAYRNGNQENIVTATVTKVQLNAETYDLGANFDSSVNYRFTAPVSGYYLITAKITYFNIIALRTYETFVYVNGSLSFWGRLSASLIDYFDVPATDIVYLAANDYVELYAYHEAGVDTIDIRGVSGATYMSVHLLSMD